MKKSEKEVEALVDKALCAFWDVVNKAEPNAVGGDMHPMMLALFEKAAVSAVQHWLYVNVPEPR